MIVFKQCKSSAPQYGSVIVLTQVYSAIKTYNGEGVAQPGVIKAHHSPIYTSRSHIRNEELPTPARSDRMQPHSIRVSQYDLFQALDPMARIDYTDVYELDNDFPSVKLFGKVHPDSWSFFFTQYRNVWLSIRGSAYGPSGSALPERSPPTIADTTETGTIRAAPRSGTSTKTVVRAGPPATGNNTADNYLLPNSGPITEAQMMNILHNHHMYAKKHGFTMGKTLDIHQVRRLAADPQVRASYLDGLKVRWKEEAVRRAQRTSPSDVEDDDEEQEDDREPESN